MKHLTNIKNKCWMTSVASVLKQNVNQKTNKPKERKMLVQRAGLTQLFSNVHLKCVSLPLYKLCILEPQAIVATPH